MKRKNILVLGADGMVGQTVFRYLSSLFPKSTSGTTRNKKNLSPIMFYLNTQSYEKDFLLIKKTIGDIDYLINCIAVLDESKEDELFFINGKFPHVIEEMAQKYD